MASNWIGPAATAVGAVVAATVGGMTVASGIASLTMSARIRASVRRDQEILKELLPESRAAHDLRGSIELRIERLIDLELLGQDPPYRTMRGIVLYLRCALLAALALMAVAYFAVSATLVKRWVPGSGRQAMWLAIIMIVSLPLIMWSQLGMARRRLDRRAEKVLAHSARPRGHIDEPGVVNEGDGAGGSVPLLGDDDVHLPRPR